jgi:uncharacterized membrane protein YqaE (UPF0057 family)
MSCSRVLLCILLPPLAVLDKGCGSVVLVTLLTCLGWIPGVLAALIITGQQPAVVVQQLYATPQQYGAAPQWGGGPGPGSPAPVYHPPGQPAPASSPGFTMPELRTVILIGCLVFVAMMAGLGMLLKAVDTPAGRPTAVQVAAVVAMTPTFARPATLVPATAVPPTFPPIVLTENAKREGVATEIAPTNTPEPTPTPLPAAMTAAERAYVNKVTQQATDLGQALTDLTALTTNPDPTSNDWLIKAAVASAQISLIADQIYALQAPASLEELDIDWKSAAGHFRNSMNLMGKGIDNQDTDALSQSAREMQAGQSNTADVNRLLRAFLTDHQ